MCRTRDVSDIGVCLDTAAWLPVGTRVSLALTDPRAGSVIEVIGDIVREENGKEPALGMLLIDPAPEWKALVMSAARQSGTLDKPGRRMRVLVIGDNHRQRGAMALYVSSGWDVVFGDHNFALHEVLDDIKVDAVIAELDAGDPRIETIMYEANKAQPGARRIVRGLGPRRLRPRPPLRRSRLRPRGAARRRDREPRVAAGWGAPIARNSRSTHRLAIASGPGSGRNRVPDERRRGVNCGTPPSPIVASTIIGSGIRASSSPEAMRRCAAPRIISPRCPRFARARISLKRAEEPIASRRITRRTVSSSVAEVAEPHERAGQPLRASRCRRSAPAARSSSSAG